MAGKDPALIGHTHSCLSVGPSHTVVSRSESSCEPWESEAAVNVTDLYRRVPGTARPSRQQAHGAWAAVSTLRHESEHPLVVGAYLAAEWTLELTDVRPMARARLTLEDLDLLAVCDDPSLVHEVDRATIADELLMATEVLQRSGGESTALGVYVWLAWWLGVRDLPDQFIPSSEAFEQLRAG